LLDLVEPGRGVRGRTRIPHQFGAPALAELIDQACGKISHIDLDAVRHDGKNVRPLRLVRPGVAMPQPPRAEPGQGQ
jgi:hypothetical protein